MTIFLPCLLERWSSETSSPNRAVLSTWQDVRRDVIRNLEWLLNTEAPLQFGGRPPPEAVANSVLCFGIEPYSGKAQSSMDPSEIAWHIRRRILAFETRVDRHALEVTVTDPGARSTFNKLRFTVHGFLRADPLPIEFIVQTEIDTESGQARILG